MRNAFRHQAKKHSFKLEQTEQAEGSRNTNANTARLREKESKKEERERGRQKKVVRIVLRSKLCSYPLLFHAQHTLLVVRLHCAWMVRLVIRSRGEWADLDDILRPQIIVPGPRIRHHLPKPHRRRALCRFDLGLGTGWHQHNAAHAATGEATVDDGGGGPRRE